MARGINKVILVGNVGQDPEIRYTPSGGAVINLTIATSETWKDKNTLEKKEKTEWHRVVMYARLAEIAGEYLRKGSKVYLEGRLQTREWQDKSGQKRYTTEIIANELQMLDSRTQAAPQNQQQQQAQSQKQPVPQQQQQSTPPAYNPYNQVSTEFDDEIPF